jgi:hypothetical protein
MTDAHTYLPPSGEAHDVAPEPEVSRDYDPRMDVAIDFLHSMNMELFQQLGFDSAPWEEISEEGQKYVIERAKGLLAELDSADPVRVDKSKG